MFIDRDSQPTDPTIPDGKSPGISRRTFLEKGLIIGGTIAGVAGLANAGKIGDRIGEIVHGSGLTTTRLRMPADRLAEIDIRWEEFIYPSLDQRERAMLVANTTKSAAVVSLHPDIAIQVLKRDTQRWDPKEGFMSFQPRLDHSESLLNSLRNIATTEREGREATGFECVYRDIDYTQVGLPNRGMIEITVSGDGRSEPMDYTIRVDLLDSKLKQKVNSTKRDLKEIGYTVWNRARRIFNLHPKISSMFTNDPFQDISDDVVIFSYDFVGEMLASGEESALAMLQELSGRTLILSADSYGDKFRLQVINPSQRIYDQSTPSLPVNNPTSRGV